MADRFSAFVGISGTIREEQPAQPDVRGVVLRWAGTAKMDISALAV